jgi:hypothetical protein
MKELRGTYESKTLGWRNRKQSPESGGFHGGYA